MALPNIQQQCRQHQSPAQRSGERCRGGQATVFPKEPPSGTGRGRVQSPRLSDKQLRSLIPRRRCQASRPLSVLSPWQEFPFPSPISPSLGSLVTAPESGPGSPVLPSLLPHRRQSWSWLCPPLGWLLVFYMVVSSLSLGVCEQRWTATKERVQASGGVRLNDFGVPQGLLPFWPRKSRLHPGTSVPGSWSAWVPPS